MREHERAHHTLTPRLQAIVEGRTHLSPWQVMRYRQFLQDRFQLPPTPFANIPEMATLVGDRLRAIVFRETGRQPCSGCLAEIDRLNTMTAAEIDADRQNIIDGIIERGRHQLKWWSPGGFAIQFAPEQVRALVESWLDEALLTAAKPPG